MDCLARDRCSKHGTAMCNRYCYGYSAIAFQVDYACIPLLYRKFRYNELKIPAKVKQLIIRYCQNVVSNVENGYSLYFYGSNGTGKTATACAILIEYLLRKALTAKQEPQGMFVVVPEFLSKLRNYMGNDEYSLLFDTLRQVKLLVMDDIGSERPTEWVKEKLFELINYRYSNNLATIYTSNIPPKLLEVEFDKRIAFRIGQATKICFDADWEASL